MRHLWILGTISVAVLILIAAVAAFFLLRNTPETPESTDQVSFPVVEPSGAGSSDVRTIVIPAADGSPVTVRDFIQNGSTVSDTQNPGIYYLAGSPGYCFDDGACPTAENVPGVNITYSSEYGTFTIAILEEPLSATRISAQNFLMTTLGLNQQQMCSLSTYVGTDTGVNENFAGQNLGLSFCPDSVQLP